MKNLVLNWLVGAAIYLAFFVLCMIAIIIVVVGVNVMTGTASVARGEAIGSAIGIFFQLTFTGTVLFWGLGYAVRDLRKKKEKR